MELNNCTANNRKPLSFFWSVLPMVVMLGGISIGYFIFNIRAEPMILMGTATASFIAIAHGYTWEDILQSICNKISEALPVILIVASIGFLIGAWMVSGTIPMMIYYGLKWINPQYFYISAFMLGALISVCTGTSWGSIGTVGIAMIGVAIGLNVSLPIAAGAIVSGCWFGDKLSPVSDSTNMAALAAGVNLYSISATCCGLPARVLLFAASFTAIWAWALMPRPARQKTLPT